MKHLLLAILLSVCYSQSYAFQNCGTTSAEKIKTKGTFGEVLAFPIHSLRLSTTKSPMGNFEEISYGDDKRNYFIICRPDSNCSTPKKEVVIYIHGGGWHFGSPKQHDYLAGMLSAYGYTVVMPGYRLGPKYCYEDIQLDLDEAFLMTLKEVGISPDDSSRIILGGASAGANLAALLAFDNERLERLGINPKIVKGFFSLAGVLDLNTMEKSGLLTKYAGETNSATFCMANPINYVDEQDNFSSLIIHGTHDGMVDHLSAISFTQYLKDYNLPYKFYSLDNESHLVVTTKWYYKTKKDVGQSALLLNWLLNL